MLMLFNTNSGANFTKTYSFSKLQVDLFTKHSLTVSRWPMMKRLNWVAGHAQARDTEYVSVADHKLLREDYSLELTLQGMSHHVGKDCICIAALSINTTSCGRQRMC